MSCPSPEDLVKTAFDESAASAETKAHMRGCATCTASVNQWREVAALLQVADPGDVAAGGCLDELTIAALASGNSAALTPETTSHLSRCAHCRAQLAGAIEVLRAPEIGEEIARLDARKRPGQSRKFGVVRVALLAAALAGLLLVPALVRDAGDAGRRARDLRDTDPTITKTLPPRVVAPLGVVSAVHQLTWTSVPSASRYNVRLFAHDGTVVWETETSDTTIALPATVKLAPNNVYLFQVDAHTGWNRSAQSELAEFRIGDR